MSAQPARNVVQFSESTIIKAPVNEVYAKLIHANEQLNWNTLYLEARTEPTGEVRTGTVLTGKFKGSGKETVHFENVIPNKEFTHYSKLMMFNLIYLGEFRHKYEVADQDGTTKFTQTVYLEPRGLGKLLKGILVASFKKRMPESFEEFRAYAEK